jgi:hypothetical protein|tara:strand:+ start:1114 stop:1335 length:222 start_codon:yes stop_codon:yes gene_type:complete
MIDFRAHRSELEAQRSAIISLSAENRTPELLERMCWLGNAITHADFCVDRQLGGKQWKIYERRTGRSTLEIYT